MFCPNCGKSDQQENTYCRQCGVFLPDFTKQGKRRVSPEEHIKSNIILDSMTIFASLTLSILLLIHFLGKDNTSPLIYITVGFLVTISAWQSQTLWRSFQLKKHFRERRPETNDEQKPHSQNAFHPAPSKQSLNEANFADVVSPSITENTTKKLKENVVRKSS